jgi:hypothetical protein
LAERTNAVGSSPFNSRAVVSWQGRGQPITLTAFGPNGEVAVALTPVRALELAKELLQPAVVSIKTAQWGDFVAGVATGTETRPHRLPRAERRNMPGCRGPRLVLSS